MGLCVSLPVLAPHTIPTLNTKLLYLHFNIIAFADVCVIKVFDEQSMVKVSVL